MEILSCNEQTDSTTVKNTCPFCKKSVIKKFKLSEFNNWRFNGILIQNAMPNTSADDREFLMTGICADCFPKEDD